MTARKNCSSAATTLRYALSPNDGEKACEWLLQTPYIRTCICCRGLEVEKSAFGAGKPEFSLAPTRNFPWLFPPRVHVACGWRSLTMVTRYHSFRGLFRVPYEVPLAQPNAGPLPQGAWLVRFLFPRSRLSLNSEKRLLVYKMVRVTSLSLTGRCSGSCLLFSSREHSFRPPISIGLGSHIMWHAPARSATKQNKIANFSTLGADNSAYRHASVTTRSGCEHLRQCNKS